jgi:Domain of unknown function (DUF397)
VTGIAGWRKPLRSVNNGACVEVGQGDAVIGVRDSRLEFSPVLVFGAGTWVAFTARLKAA